MLPPEEDGPARGRCGPRGLSRRCPWAASLTSRRLQSAQLLAPRRIVTPSLIGLRSPACSTQLQPLRRTTRSAFLDLSPSPSTRRSGETPERREAPPGFATPTSRGQIRPPRRKGRISGLRDPTTSRFDCDHRPALLPLCRHKSKQRNISVFSPLRRPAAGSIPAASTTNSPLLKRFFRRFRAPRPVRAPRRAQHLQESTVGHARIAPSGPHVGVAEEGLEGALGDLTPEAYAEKAGLAA
jgi:hypothetical protein